MDDVYAMELLQQSLIDASDRENQLMLELQAAQEAMEQWKHAAFVSKSKFQELDQALEDEEVKTNAERLARQEAEEATRQHQIELLKAKQRETIANDHCDAAEVEVLRLQSELSAQCSARAAADLVLSQVGEDLRLAEHNGNTTFGQLNVAKAKISTLLKDLGIAKTRISILEGQAREPGENSEKEHEQKEEEGSGLCGISHELKNLWLELKVILGMYNDIFAEHSRRNVATAMAATALSGNVIDVNNRLHPAVESGNSIGSGQVYEQVLDFERRIGDRTAVKAASGLERKQPTKMPALPEPAILRSALTSTTTCQLDMFKVTPKLLPAPRAKLQNSAFQCLWRARSNSLHVPVRGPGRR